MGLTSLNILLSVLVLFILYSSVIAQQSGGDTDDPNNEPTKTTTTTTTTTTERPTTTTTTTTTTAPPTTPPTTRDPPGECECDPCNDDRVVIDLQKPGLTLDTAVSGSIPGLNVTFYSGATTQGLCDARVLLHVDFLTYPPCDSSRYCYCMNGTKCSRRILQVQFRMGDSASGWMFNIGDSATNNGNGGDSSTQTNDAEMQCVHPNVTIFQSDKCAAAKLATIPDGCKAGSDIVFGISDGQIRYTSDSLTSPYNYCHNCLYALNNQEDDTGPRNERVFFSLNRVVNGDASRIGNGLCRARFRWICPPCEH